jgi:Fe-S cluster assembly protein SufD
MARKSTPFADVALAAGAPWIDALRGDALACYRDQGLPTMRREAWKFTNLRRLERIAFAPSPLENAPIADIPDGIAALDGAYRAVFVNGCFDAARSSLDNLPKGVEIGSLAAVDPDRLEPHLGRIADTRTHPLAALNTAYMSDGLYMKLADNAVLDAPLHLISIASAGDTALRFHPRHLVILGENAIATLVESHVGTGETFANTVLEADLGVSAVLNHYKLQNEGPDAFHIAFSQIRLADRASYDGFVLQVGARLARNEVRVHLGNRVECRLNGAYLGRGDQHIDNTTFIDHTAPNSTSREVYKGVLDERARGVFQGKILVRKDAQKTSGHQLNKTLLLSRGTEMDSKPELEIYADDVKCGHGATTGELEEDALFYLQTRGIGLAQARGILVAAFLSEAVSEIQAEGPRAAFQAVVDQWLDATEVSAR